MVKVEEVKHIAALARLKFSQKELLNYTEQLNKVLSYMEKLNELNTDNVEPFLHPLEAQNVFRQDELIPHLSTEEALKNAPDRDDKYFLVPKVISKEQ